MKLYIVTTGLPGPDPSTCGFIDTEDEQGNNAHGSVGLSWTPHPTVDGMYRLGPFAPVPVALRRGSPMAGDLAGDFDAWRGDHLPATYDEALDMAAGAMRAASDEAGWRGLAEIAFSHYPLVEIVGKSEAAAMFGKNPNNLKRDVPELPEPEWELKATPVWRRKAVQAIVDARAAAAQKGGE